MRIVSTLVIEFYIHKFQGIRWNTWWIICPVYKGFRIMDRVCLFVNGLFRPSVPRRTTSMKNIITTSPDNTQSLAASASSPAGPYLRCHWGDNLRIAALTQDVVLYVRNFAVPYAENLHIFLYTHGLELAIILKFFPYSPSYRVNFFKPLSRCGLVSDIA